MPYSDAVFIRNERAPRGFVQPHRLSGLSPDTPLLVGFSGGADSTLLLYLTVRYAASAGCPVYAAHLNHGIRGEEADRDEAFCRDFAAQCGIPLFIGHADVPALQRRTGDSIETAARKVRYAFFARLMAGNTPDFDGEIDIAYIPTADFPVPPCELPVLLTAHHADDQVETVLLRLLRGTGIKGLTGIPPVRSVSGGQVIRPLLRCTKADILSACEALGLSYVTDSSNLSDDANRNALRLTVLPALSRIAGEGVPEAAVTRLTDSVREDSDCLDSLADGWYRVNRTENGLPTAAMSALPPALLNRVLLRAYREAVLTSLSVTDNSLPADRTLTADRLSALRGLVEKAVPHSRVTLPFGFTASVGDAPACLLTFSPFTAVSAGPVGQIELVEGDNRFGDLTVRVETVPLPSSPDASVLCGYFPVSLRDQILTARNRQPGDCILCHGMHKSLKKLCCDRHVPLSLREKLPLICVGGDILWVPGVAFADGYPAPVQGTALCISVSGIGIPFH